MIIVWGPICFTVVISTLCLVFSAALGTFAIAAPNEFSRVAINWRQTAKRLHGVSVNRIQRDRLLLSRPRVFGGTILLLSLAYSAMFVVVLHKNAHLFGPFISTVP